MLNITNLSQFGPSDVCLTSSHAYNAVCLQKWFCPQIPHYLVTYGIALLGAEILFTVILWFLKINKAQIEGESINWSIGIFYLKIPMDFSIEETYLYWKSLLSELFTFGCAIYIIMVVSWAW
jgi:hypothetical protein